MKRLNILLLGCMANLVLLTPCSTYSDQTSDPKKEPKFDYKLFEQGIPYFDKTKLDEDKFTQVYLNSDSAAILYKDDYQCMGHRVYITKDDEGNLKYFINVDDGIEYGGKKYSYKDSLIYKEYIDLNEAQHIIIIPGYTSLNKRMYINAKDIRTAKDVSKEIYEKYRDFYNNTLEKVAKEKGHKNFTDYYKATFNAPLPGGQSSYGNTKPAPSNTNPARGEAAVQQIVNVANSLYKSGRISAQSLSRILNYKQHNYGMTVYQFMIEKNITAEEFCLGVDSGKIFLSY
jgi:hypothetical protein